MKCPKCNGKGMVDYPMYADDEHKWQYCVARMKKCDMCNGTGEVEQTEQEYLQSCNTEQLAEWIASVVQKAISIKENNGIVMLESAIWWEEWLKQPHKE